MQLSHWLRIEFALLPQGKHVLELKFINGPLLDTYHHWISTQHGFDQMAYGTWHVVCNKHKKLRLYSCYKQTNLSTEIPKEIEISNTYTKKIEFRTWQIRKILDGIVPAVKSPTRWTSVERILAAKDFVCQSTNRP